jgi:predicted dienelactone hydrolase
MNRTIALILLLVSIRGFADEPPSRYGVDAPELARLGPYAVGVKTLQLIERAQPDVLAFDPARASAPLRDRVLGVELWYPAHPSPGAAHVSYTGSLPSESPAPPAQFSVSGIAVRDAPSAGQGYPLVIVSHGYSNDPVAMTWLTENLASKGYVVAAIRHSDPPITDRSKYPQLLLRRPLDIAYAAQTLRRTLGAQHLIDARRTALIGYSMGGYGVLTAAGATLDPAGQATKIVPGGLLLPYTRGGPLQELASVKGLRAVVAISPAGGGTLAAWGCDGLHALTVPLLLIAGDHDRTVNYSTGARAIFDTAVNAPRYLLTFKEGGHSIGLNPAPDAMRKRLWDQDWFEDPVWRKERLNAINAHFITAFLDRYVKDDETRGSYLDVPVAESSDGVWPVPAALAAPPAYDAYSPGPPDVTLWKGFQQRHAEGLELLHALAPSTAPAEQRSERADANCGQVNASHGQAATVVAAATAFRYTLSTAERKALQHRSRSRRAAQGQEAFDAGLIAWGALRWILANRLEMDHEKVREALAIDPFTDATGPSGARRQL